jgi:small subunit ribosomal protein S5
MLKATVNGLQRLRRPDEVAATRGLTISQVLPVSAKHEEAEAAPEQEPQPEAPAEAESEPVAVAAEESAKEGDGEADDHADA